MLAGMARRQEGHFMGGGGMSKRGGGSASQYGNFAPYGLLDWFHETSVSGSQSIAEDLETEGQKRKPAMKKGANKANGAIKNLRNQPAESESESSENDELDDSDGGWTKNLTGKDGGQGWADSLKGLGGGGKGSNDGGGSWKEAITSGRSTRRSVRRN